VPCLLGIAALLGPRIFLLVLWFLTDWFAGMFASLLWPVLGLVVALAIDVSPAAGRRG
jgi:hypothetical protein